MSDQTVPAPIDDADDTAESGGNLAPGMTRVRLKFLECLIFSGLTMREAAEAVGITDRGARKIMRDPRVLKIYQAMLAALRASERPRAIRRLAELRDQGKSERIIFEAARELQREPSASPIVNVGVNVGIRPGYIVAIDPEMMVKAKRLLADNGPGAVATDLDLVDIDSGELR